ncbi:HD domain-containing protein [Actinomadura madurae]|uniref:HD domain-containing protein n=1 Tax=Actinomadura madurae TaxID=1993 RepID=UPI002026684C|nr:HD domain-containing protein [Actinomadura madurae]MCP9955110.1 HDIG domain-containing protein [Actinomadura madurae]MCP9984346.1 HDIG domain-containing protein [Actinomadura madurae]MCQ0004100.1 HDIG domain-containing protein [Actinomadura madurae]MCQ0020540.1 HDIG domain-containing protein [Actinomadura madurae]URN02742.1 HDIG domain-containing protein [Actinomadura madurae]
MRVPGDEEIRALHERHAPSPEAFDLVWTHCAIVCEIAEELMQGGGLDVDKDLVRAGCLLHDIGVYRLYDDAGRLDYQRYVRHGLLGHELLHDEGFPDEICRFCSRHTGVGLTRDDIARLGLPVPAVDLVAETGEERLVMYADKFHSKTQPPTFVSAETYAVRVRRYGEEKVAVFEAMREFFGEPDLASLADGFGHALV